ncbi:putative ser thr protein phosphatase [Phaeomoniella chlamydospora]|uniref:Putative ser thr protein phosphatase n=1 Tax=Phaeomoniella chlamydospora TaxID=158046 RepID=A0A0G2EF82_PHACM|nr:putative ser thr protein phosphatase [Phaeomoniella chlamydospora]
MDRTGGLFGANARPKFTDMVHIKKLDPSLVPKSNSLPTRPSLDSRRLIFIGDIHGCKEELLQLLEEVKFDKRTDHLILLGDIITKGPESLDVIDVAIEMGASCIRGNHEDRVLLTYKDMMSTLLPLKGPNEPASLGGVDNLDEESFSQGDYSDRALARRLKKKHYNYLSSCPVILRVGRIGKLGEVVAVHAGMVPGISLELQDPYSVMTMRSIDLVSHIPSKLPPKDHVGKYTLNSDADAEKHQYLISWTKLWNKYQNLIPNPKRAFSRGNKEPELHTTVIYGHDSKQGLQIQKWTIGLDTGCVKGGKLTALIIADGAAMSLRDVQCKDHRPRKPLQAEVEDVLREGAISEGNRPENDESEE